MAKWVKSKTSEGEFEIWVNLDMAQTLLWESSAARTVVRFGSKDMDKIEVKDRPGSLIKNGKKK